MLGSVTAFKMVSKMAIIRAKSMKSAGCFVELGPVVRKSISANQGLKVNRGFYFSYLKMFLKANFKLEMKKSQSRNRRQKVFRIIDAYPGLG